MKGDEFKGTLWCVPRGRWFSTYVEHWRKSDGSVDVSPFGIPEMSIRFDMKDLIEVVKDGESLVYKVS